jgi:tetratricopeptide (TPR) repeat protein
VTLERAVELRAACDYRGALAALATADDAPALLERSRLHEDLGDYAAARADAERVYVLTDGAPSARARLAAVARVERRCHDALLILEGVPGPEALVERAGALEELAELDEAERLFRSLEPESARLRHAVRLGLAGIALARGLYDDAEHELRTAIAGAEADFGADSIETGSALNTLGMVFKYAGRFDEGLELYLRALQILERAGGMEHPDVAAIYHNLGGLEHARRNYAEAEPHARRSVELRRLTLGPDHPAVAEDEAAWASILHALGRDEEAEPLLRRAIDVIGKALGPNHPEVGGAWNNLAAVLQRRGDLAGADAAYRRALEIKEGAMGPEHPAVAITLNNLAVNARLRGEPGEAESLYHRALVILEGRVEPDHPNLLLTRRNYAKLLREEEGKKPALPPV